MNVHEKAAWDELAERNAKLEARNAKLERVVEAAWDHIHHNDLRTLLAALAALEDTP